MIAAVRRDLRASSKEGTKSGSQMVPAGVRTMRDALASAVEVFAGCLEASACRRGRGAAAVRGGSESGDWGRLLPSEVLQAVKHVNGIGEVLGYANGFGNGTTGESFDEVTMKKREAAQSYIHAEKAAFAGDPAEMRTPSDECPCDEKVRNVRSEEMMTRGGTVRSGGSSMRTSDAGIDRITYAQREGSRDRTNPPLLWGFDEDCQGVKEVVRYREKGSQVRL